MLPLLAIMCTLLAVLGLLTGLYWVRSTSGNQEQEKVSVSPYTDISPSFQTSQLTFNKDSPEALVEMGAKLGHPRNPYLSKSYFRY